MTENVQFQQVSEIPGLVLSTAHFADFSFDRHFHLDFHVGLVTDGVQRQRVNGKTVMHAPGTVVLMPPGEIHDGVVEDGSQSTLKTFRLSRELVASVAEEISGHHREPEFAGALLEDPLLAGHLLRLHDAMRRRSAASGLEMQTEWLTLLECLLSQARAIVPETVPGSLSRIQWERVKDYCFSHLSDKITLDELAALCSLGRFQFLKQFRQTIGMTPHAWLLRLRLERACALLSRSSQAIATVAQEVGFYDQSHFNRAFRQAYGVAPSSYRT
ncbi:HTH-type transcriptional activator RhaS [Paraburkholderia aspalathi]|uniref:helix-turn-helix transcriptional regulator n=1 Tax=Paraburkholderia aspalathi TaxID=1324617 RepID=UPI00190C6CF3|nr:AraC family transcriptional regulator [Paraburkholderia aspalathi]MBK3840229.1 AraC family transcriptional regulator [Paraburkholderia aspalathi]CAE6779012.1 HTH-type transcriptional activator RhaS [Paraburkholderia aspalathi]